MCLTPQKAKFKIELNSDVCPDISTQVKVIASSVKTLTDQWEKQAEELASIKLKLDKTESDMSESVDKLNSAHVRWSDIVKDYGSNTERVTVSHVKKALEEISEKDKEMMIRSRGIVIYNAKEKVSDLVEPRKHDDRKIVNDLLSHIGCGEVSVESANRLGRFDKDRVEDGKFSPIKVRFSSSDERDRVLRS